MADIRINSLPSTATSFNTDDYIAIDGASGGTRKMLAATLPLTDVTLGGASGPSVKSSLSARAPRQGLVFDGSGAATVTTASIGTADFTLAAWVNPVDWADRYIFGIGASYDGLYVNDGTGELFFFNGANVVSGLIIPIGKTSLVTVRRSSGTLYFGLNGIETAGVAMGTSLGAVTKIGDAGAGGYRWNGTLSGGLVYNRALSASEVVALYEAGAPAGADYNSASNTAVYSTDFSSSTGWSLGGSTTISGGKLNLVSDDFAGAPSSTELVIGKRYRFTITVDSITAGNVSYFNGAAYVSFATSAGTYTVDFTAAGSYSFIVIKSIGGNAVCDTFAFYKTGLLLAPDAAQAGGGLVWYDTSGNAANITLPASGVSWNVPTSGNIAANANQNVTITTSGTGRLVVPKESSAVNDYTAVFGTSLASSTGSDRVKVCLGNPDGNSELSVGQSGGNNLIFGWTYNATAANAYGFLNSYGGSNRLVLQGDGGNVLIGTTTDGGQKLQVSGTIAASLGVSSNGSLAAFPAANSAAMDWNGGYARFWGVGADASTAGGLKLVVSSTDGSPFVEALTIASSGDATFAGKITANGAGSTFKGTATNDNAAAGYMGEYAETSTVYASRITLTTDTVANVASVSLTAGDWDVSGNVELEMSGVTSTDKRSGVSTTSASLTNNPDTCGVIDLPTTTLTGYLTIPTPTVRISIASTTTVYLPTKVTFSAGTTKAWGIIRARRVR